MRLPQSPPSDWTTSKHDRLIEALTRVHSSCDEKGRYLHWDELRRRTPPEGLSREEWWFGLTFYRHRVAKRLPLRANDGVRFFSFVIPDSLQELLHQTDLQAGGTLGTRERGSISPEQQDRYLVTSLMEESISSSLIEGAATTRSEAKELLRSGREPASHGERMVRNNYRAMRHLKSLQERELSEELIMDLHALLTEGTLESDNQAGRFRWSEERIRVMDENDQVLHVPPDASDLPSRMKALCDFANGKTPDYFIHPVVRSILIHFWLAYDHPFVDGNGRTARALFYWSMLRHKYWLFEFISISEVLFRHVGNYRMAFLYCEKGEPDATYFILNQMDAIREALQYLHRYVQKKSAEVRQLEQRMRNETRFNYRQLALISHALRHPNHRYTVKSHETSHNVTPQTARTDLKELCDSGLFEMQKRKGEKTFEFFPSAGLERKLEAL